MGLILVVSVFMILFGLVPVFMILEGAIDGGYQAFLKGVDQGSGEWIFLLLCFPIGLFGAWKSQLAIEKRERRKPPNIYG